MDMGDIFRRLFGFRSPSRDSHRLLDDFNNDDNENDSGSFTSENNENQEGISIFFDNRNGIENMFEHFHGDMQRQMEAMQKQMEDMMRGFGVIDFSVFQGPRFKAPHDAPGKDNKIDGGNTNIWFGSVSPFFHNREIRNPRDFMLKDDADVHNSEQKSTPIYKSPIYVVPHDDQQSTKDSDLDGKISEDRLLDLIKKPKQIEPADLEQPLHRQPSFFSASNSFSFSTCRGPDGRVQEKKVLRDSSGREESTVTIKLGDKSYTVTEVTHPDGKQEKKESYNNVEEKELNQFLDSWNKPGGRSLMPQPHPEVDSKDSDLFSKLFGRRF